MASASLLIPILVFLSMLCSSSVRSASPLAPTKSPSASLDPKQVAALRSLNLATKSDPCSTTAALLCDSAAPFRHVVSLSLSNCSRNHIRLSTAALDSLSTLTSFRLAGCRVARLRFLSRTKGLRKLTVSDANLTGNLPKNWFDLNNLTVLDFSSNKLKGEIPDTISVLETLESLNLSSNQLDGGIPSSIGHIASLKNISLSSNSISGAVPSSIGELRGLECLDLGSNQLNGTIPHSISGIKSLKYLNLENNNFVGVMPFNASFIKKLEVFRIGGNRNLCYNHSVLSSKVKLGIAPCDRHGLPLSPPQAKDDSSSSSDDYNDDDDTPGDERGKSRKNSHGTNKVVLGVAIGLSAVVFLIIFCVLISKCCR